MDPGAGSPRQATAWAWEVQTGATRVANGTVQTPGADTGNLSYATNYAFVVFALNQFNRTSASIKFTSGAKPTATPNIAVTRVGNTNKFQVNGTGFDALNGQTVLVNVDTGASFPGGKHSAQQPVTVNQGTFETIIDATSPCTFSGGKGSPMRIYVSLQGEPGAIGNIFNSSCN
jgi:hypothetical protein